MWQQADASTLYSIWSNRYVAGTGWSTAGRIEADLGDAAVPQVAFDGSGNAVAVWRQDDGNRYSIWSNRYVASTGLWSMAELIETNTGDVDVPQVVVDASGNALAVWRQHDGTSDSIWSNRYVAE